MITIVIGCIIVAVGFVFFINPYNIVPGGVYGLGIVLHNIFPSIQVGTFGYMFDIPLLTIAIILFGKQFASGHFRDIAEARRRISKQGAVSFLLWSVG